MSRMDRIYPYDSEPKYSSISDYTGYIQQFRTLAITPRKTRCALNFQGHGAMWPARFSCRREAMLQNLATAREKRGSSAALRHPGRVPCNLPPAVPTRQG